VRYQKTIFTLLLVPTLVGCDGFNIGNGMTKVAEARECYEATRAISDVMKSKADSAERKFDTRHYDIVISKATDWFNIACKDSKL
jgi:hypothetical protein